MDGHSLGSIGTRDFILYLLLVSMVPIHSLFRDVLSLPLYA